MARSTGTVQWFNNAKGYGFVSTESGPDVFVHWSGIEGEGYKSLKEGDAVEFEISTGPGGRAQAEKVRKITAGAPQAEETGPSEPAQASE